MRSWLFLFCCNLMWALQFTCIKLVQDQVHLEWDLTEPADMRPHERATDFASANFILRSIQTSVVKRGTRATGIAAARLHKPSVHVHDAPRSSLLVQRIDILRAEEEAVAQSPLEFS